MSVSKERPDLPYIHKNIMAHWARFPARVQERLIKRNAREAIRAAARATRARPKFDREKERQRGKFARRLVKWLDTNGRKLPAGEKGIARHQAMVAMYEALYGSISKMDQTTYDNTYADILRQAGIEAEHAAQVAALLERGSWLMGGPTAPSDGTWYPRWSKKPFAPFRELQNIPADWEMRKVVLAWRDGEPQYLRVFSSQQEGYQTKALIELTGSGDLEELGFYNNRWDFAITREQYDRAISVTIRRSTGG